MKLVKWTPIRSSVNMFDDLDTIFSMCKNFRKKDSEGRIFIVP